MRAFLKKHFGGLYVALMTVAILVIFAVNNELGDIVNALKNMNARCSLLAVGMMLFYLFLRAWIVWFYVRGRGYKLTMRQAMSVTGAGQFYSAVTPSATGGQPAQVLRLRRYGVPGSVGSACITVEFIGFQTSFLLLGLLGCILDGKYLYGHVGSVVGFVALGFFVNTILVVLVLLAVANIRLVTRMSECVIRLLSRLHIVRDAEKAAKKVAAQLLGYREAMQSLTHRPLDILVIFAVSLLEVAVHMAIPVCMYYAFSLSGTSAVRITELQLLLFISAAFVPLPGASGAQEGGFCLFYDKVFPQEFLFPAMVCWRFFTYYFGMFAGAAMMLIGDTRFKKEQTEQGECAHEDQPSR